MFKQKTYEDLTRILSLMQDCADNLEEDIDFLLNECDEEDDLSLFYSHIEDRIYRLKHLYSQGEDILEEEE